MRAKIKKILAACGSYIGVCEYARKPLIVFDFPFESTWKTNNVGTSDDDQIKLPLEATGTYNFTVFWGDGSKDHITAWDQEEVTHTYSTAGTYTVKITAGTINGWRFNNTGDKLKILTIENWSELLLGNSNDYFYGCENLVVNATDVLDVSSVTTFTSAFRNCSSLVTLDVSSWDVSGVTTFARAFRDCSSLVTLDVSSWDVSSVTTFYYAFYGCTSLTSIDVSSWNISSATTFAATFYGCSSLTTLALDNWTITSITDMPNMLGGVTLTTANYDAILIAWAAQEVQSGVNFHAGNSKYTGGGAAETARTHLVSVHTWVITDNGVAL